MRSNGPTLLALPAFHGLTRKLILLAVCSFIFFFVLRLISPGLAGAVAGAAILSPVEAPRLIWQFLTWPFVPDGLLNVIFALISLWYFGSALEEERGTRWFGELFLIASVGGALLATVLWLILGRFSFLNSGLVESNGMWPIVLGLLVVFARLHANETLTFDFIFRARAKYFGAIFLAIYLVIDYFTGRRFDALNTICNCLVAWMVVQFAPRRSLSHGVSESWFGFRNRYYRAKRRRAAKKFQVYMRKQGKDVSIDSHGRYIGLDDDDPNDRRRMN